MDLGKRTVREITRIGDYRIRNLIHSKLGGNVHRKVCNIVSNGTSANMYLQTRERMEEIRINDIWI
jgi:hypothetical protein